MPGHQNPARVHINGWSLRTKVAVVLMLPAVVALVLGGARVQSRLDDASRLSTVRDQLGVLRETVGLSELIAREMAAAVLGTPPGGVSLDDRKADVDERVASVQRGADFTRLPADAGRILSDSLGRLGALRLQAAGADGDPITEIVGYLEVMNGLSELVPGVVSLARDDDLDDAAAAAMSLLRLRAILASEETLLRFGGSSVDTAIAAAAQRAAAEETVLGEQVRRAIPSGNAAALEAATRSAPARRDALQAAVAGSGTLQAAASLLPALTTESEALDGLLGELVDALAANVSARTNVARSEALRDAAIVLGALLAALAIALIVARSLLAPVRTLRSAALAAAHHQLPETVERVRAGEQVDWRTIEPVPVHTGEEIGQLARAFDDMHQQAVRLAGEQAELRRQVSEMFTTLSRRSQSLVELQLEVIEGLESDEQDPRRLDGLFRLDHLATRLRRNGENLQVLAGSSPARRGQGPVTVVELLRAATSEVNDYKRVSLGHAPNGSVRPNAAADVVHILAELLENATRFSPPDRKVVLTADRGSDGGLLIEAVDAGLGMAADDLAATNRRLSAADDVSPETTRRMGLFVVSRLAERHGVTVRLRPTYDSATNAGITASVHLPAALITAEGTPNSPDAAPEVRLPARRPARGWFAALTDVDTPAAEQKVAQHGQAQPVASPRRWMKPAEKTGRKADTAMSRQPSATTAAGLPLRKPGAGVVPAGSEREPTVAGVGFRDPEAIRSNLARHYDGVRAARLRTQTEPDAREGP